ncbi:MAG TPA: hypothetical protein DCP71_05015 [Verrucomicrobiales bacterium]|nr:hypothetical protein [Verrucomicrobiales bacterium]
MIQFLASNLQIKFSFALPARTSGQESRDLRMSQTIAASWQTFCQISGTAEVTPVCISLDDLQHPDIEFRHIRGKTCRITFGLEERIRRAEIARDGMFLRLLHKPRNEIVTRFLPPDRGNRAHHHDGQEKTAQSHLHLR